MAVRRSGPLDGVVVRSAKTRDCPQIAELSADLGYPTPASALARRLEGLDPANNLVLVAEARGAVVGWVHAFVSHRLEEDPFAELGGLIVAKDHRGAGLGRDLMSRAEAWARALGCPMFRVRSHEMRGEAHRFYERVGYRRVKRQQVLDKQLDKQRTE